MKLFAIGGTILFFILAGPARAGDFAPGSEPDGFRGIKWGTSLSAVSGLKYLRYEPRDGGVKVYSRAGENLSWNSVPLAAVEYFFSRGKLYKVSLFVGGADHWPSFQQAVFTRYGTGDPRLLTEDQPAGFTWKGSKTVMFLQAEKGGRGGYLTIESLAAYRKLGKLLDRENSSSARFTPPLPPPR